MRFNDHIRLSNAILILVSAHGQTISSILSTILCNNVTDAPTPFVEDTTFTDAPTPPKSVTMSPTTFTISDCQERINFLRAKFSITPISERKDLHSCANRQSEFDKQVGAHKSFKRCGAVGSQGSGGGSKCSNVIDMFYHERWSCSTNITLFGAPFEETDIRGSNQCRAACMNNPQCLSYGFDENFDPNPCHFYDQSSLTHARRDPNDMTAFLLGGETTEPPQSFDTFESFSIVDIDGSRTVPSDGRIVGFKWYGDNSNAVDFHVFRLVSSSIYEVVGTIHAPSTIRNQENSISGSEILVKKGDVLGFTFIGAPAFGFTDRSRFGQVRYTDENSGGPSSIGEMWDFNRGPLAREYHFSAMFQLTVSVIESTPRNYCAAGLCEGHCGPVMSNTTTIFAWGEYENHYTLNWRPNARLPFGGNVCPSGIQAVRCWTDNSTGILWAYGVGGEDCHSTCSLAGATSSDFKCDENSPIVGGFDEVSKIMANFENPYNENDLDEFTCTTGSCWSGESNKQIMIHEFNSNCYFPTNDQQYTCTTAFGNANCFGQRFNQVCPCVPGCSSAAGPSCEE